MKFVKNVTYVSVGAWISETLSKAVQYATTDADDRWVVQSDNGE